MIDHLTFGVKDVALSKKFYDAVLGTVGYKCLSEERENGKLAAAGYGTDRPVFWVGLPLDETKAPVVTNGTHLAFKAATRAEVDAFYKAALANGGVDEGAPGLRTQYGPTYYAAFVRDPDGHKIEVVCRNG